MNKSLAGRVVGAAKLPLAKELAEFDFTGSPINEGLLRELAIGTFLSQQRNTVLVGGTGTGKSHLAVAIARSCIRAGARCRFYTVVDLVNRLEAESKAGRSWQGWHRHVSLVMLAFAMMTTIRHRANLLPASQTTRRPSHAVRLSSAGRSRKSAASPRVWLNAASDLLTS